VCGRFSLFAQPEVLAEAFDLQAVPSLQPRYNIVPGESIAAVGRASEDAGPALARLRWGLLPFWVDDPDSFRATLINARAETVDEKPSFRESFRRRRCVIPASGFFEWKPSREGKQPYFVRPRGEEVFGMAGLWDRWEGEGEEAVNSCAIITTEANDALAAIHERMPVILSRGEYEPWLDPGLRDAGSLRGMLDPWPAGKTEAYRVDARVNDPSRDDPSCVEPLPDGNGDSPAG